ncbi:CLAVATA3/ESR (CLE)-related protein 10-like [Juglans regia]|uniref:CLAVATA3/ESR (CLE)-related protein 10-like n=1 Tax=Juglans regia TaxID=51240 RepID=A0A2I4DZC4_JUGRE|nr:CLAVATA3/ESR (CLE)-related protein 10-like [Juglans regia]
MESSPSSTTTTTAYARRLLILIMAFLLLLLLLLFGLASASRISKYPKMPDQASSRNYGHHQLLYPHHHQPNSCGSLSREKSRSFCFQLQRIHHYRHLPSPPPLQTDEIDPRYGVEKRLVPSGPNPLHN